MSQVSIIVAKSQLTNLLAFAGSKKLLHLVQVTGERLPVGAQRYEAGEFLARSSTVRNRVTALRSALTLGDLAPERIEAPVTDLELLAKFLDEETANLEQSVRQLEDKEGKLKIDREQTSGLSRFLSGLESIGVSLDGISGGGFLSTLAGEIASESISSIQRELDELTYGNVIFVITNPSEKAQTFLALFPNAFVSEAKQAATSLGVRLEESWINLPSDPREAKDVIEARLQEIEANYEKLEQERQFLTEKFGPRVKALEHLAEILEVRSRALSGTSTTETTYMFRAWIPQDEVEQFADGASKVCSGLVSLHSEESTEKGSASSHPDGLADGLEAGEESSAPTLVRIPGWSKPLQSVIDNFGVPSYDETNPLPFMLFTFPVMYGLMFGDFGEGPLLLFLGFLLLRIRKKGAKIADFFQPFVNGAELVLMLGIGTTIFGLIFGDFFGFESDQVFGFSPLFSPIKSMNLQPFMVFILLFGVAHMTFGLGLGAYNKVRNREYREAFFGPVCRAWFYVAGVFAISQVVLSGFKFSVALPYLPLVLVPLLLLGWKEGGLHAMEVFIQSISNTFSYLRIWALNIADFYIKFAIFVALGGPAITVTSLIGATLGNLLVMILEGLIVFVQTLRLHWVEWFGKFYEGTGISFTPYQEPISWIAPFNA